MLPREKILTIGPKMLENHELLALLLNVGTRGRSVFKIAKQVEKIIIEYQNDIPTLIFKLKNIKGIGDTQLSKILALIEFSQRYKFNNSNQLEKPTDVIKMFLFLQKAKQEHLYIILLNTQFLYQEHKLMYKGSYNLININISEIFSYILTKGVPYFIMLHNHPSGNPLPSDMDIITTQKIYKLAKQLGLSLLDHIILCSEQKYFSFKEQKLLK